MSDKEMLRVAMEQISKMRIEDILPESNKRAYNNLRKAGLI